VGETGKRLSEIDACEGASGNISLYIGWEIDPQDQFPRKKTIPLPVEVPELAGRFFIVTGSGCRLRDVIRNPAATLGLVQVGTDGKSGILCMGDTCEFQKLTSEWITHLTVHRDQVMRSGTNFHAIVHGQPLYTTYLSHIPAYRDETLLNHSLFRWEAETIVNLPQGIGLVPFHIPGSAELMAATALAMQEHQLVVWAKHGVMARSDFSANQALDLIEYIETGAHYEYLNLAARQPTDGLASDEIVRVASTWKIVQNVFSR